MNNKKIERFIKSMNSIQYENAKQVLSEIYTNDVLFVDPIKSISGIQELTQYFEELYLSVTSCEFILKNQVEDNETHALEWVMHLQHNKLSKNKTIKLDGASFIKFIDEKICYHRDYYDLGALIYENIPVMGSVVKKVRNAL